MLSINFLPNAVYEPSACIRQTLRRRSGVVSDREHHFRIHRSGRLDTKHLLKNLHAYREMGFNTAIDDFGAGFAGLGLLADSSLTSSSSTWI